MGSIRWAVLLMGMGSALGVMAGCSESSGSCDGTNLDPEGDLFYLRLYNCVAEPGTVYINDRAVGELPGYDSDANICPGMDFGSFPQCGVGEIRVVTANTESFVVNWSPEAVADNDDECWLVYQYGEPEEDDEYELGSITPELYENDLCSKENIVTNSDD